MQPFDEAMKKGKCSLASDGWQAHKRPLLNVCAVTPLGSTFIKAVDTTGETKVFVSPRSCSLTCLNAVMDALGNSELIQSRDCLQDAEYIADQWIQCIKELGAENVMHFLSDSAANRKRAGEIIEEK